MPSRSPASSRRLSFFPVPTAAFVAAVISSGCTSPGREATASAETDAPAATERPAAGPAGPPAAGPAVIHTDETHLASLRQLTFGGQNAEGYWSPDGTRII